MNEERAADTLSRLMRTIESRRSGDPAQSYTARLLSGKEDSLLKKLGEEAVEAALACKGGERSAIIAEFADLWYHSLVTLARYDIALEEVLAELARREGMSGLEEKAARKAQAR